MPSENIRVAGIALGSVVFVVGLLAELIHGLLQFFATPLMLGIVAGQLFADAILTLILGGGTLGVTFLVCQRIPIQSLSTGIIGSIALLTGILGRYVGAALGAVFRGGRIPTPVVLVTQADISLGFTDLGLQVAVLVGVLTTGVYSLIGAFGGIGVASIS